VNLGETSSSEFVQCVLWAIRLKKTVESICCAFRHTVTLLRAVWRTIRWPHSVRVLIATTTVAGRHRPSAARPTTPAVRSVGVVYHVVCQHANRLLLAASYNFCVTFSLIYYVIIIIIITIACFPIARLSFSLDTVLNHNYYITPVIKVKFCSQGSVLLIPSCPLRLTAEWTIRGESDP